MLAGGAGRQLVPRFAAAAPTSCALQHLFAATFDVATRSSTQALVPLSSRAVIWRRHDPDLGLARTRHKVCQ